MSGSGSSSSLAFDKTLGQFGENVNSSTIKLSTGSGAVSNSRVFVFVSWYSGSGTLSSVAGGGLAWTVDIQAKDKTNYHTAIASANAPNGLPSGSVLTAAFSRSVTAGLIAGASFTGVASSSPVDAVASNLQNGVAAWTGSVRTTKANDLVLGWSAINKNPTNTAKAPNVKILDFGNTTLGEHATAEYQLASATGTKTVNGTWASASGATANSTVVAAYGGG